MLTFSGIAIYALCPLVLSGGDFGASVGPQLVGVVTDAAIESSWVAQIALKFYLMVGKVGMSLGMLVGMLFPFVAILVYALLWKRKRKNEK